MGSVLEKIRGKLLSTTQIAVIRSVITEHPTAGRVTLSQLICDRFNWKQPNGRLQDMACRAILLRLEKQGWIQLPPRKSSGRLNSRKPVVELPLQVIQEPLEGRLGEYPPVRLARVANKPDSRHWNGWIQRHHYLGYKPMVGRSLRYWIFLGEMRVGCIGWGSPSWKLASRDRFIGWNPLTREKNLQGVANNTRFLIFPWVHVKYLASHVLSLCVRQVPEDWQARYGVKLFVFETFVDATRYRGTCYKAANWVHVGESKGSSKSGDSYYYHGQKKDVYLYPLVKDFRERLCQ